jgi:DNA-binding transcriptional regulator YiaG
MNQKTAKLLRKFSRISGETLPNIKRRWLASPPKRRSEVRAQMKSSLWQTKCGEWREKMGLELKNVPDVLPIPLDTWKNWEYGRNTPGRWVRQHISDLMEKAWKEKLA